MRAASLALVAICLMAGGCAPKYEATFDAKLGQVRPDEPSIWTPRDMNTNLLVLNSSGFWDEFVRKRLTVDDDEFNRIKDGVQIQIERSPDHPYTPSTRAILISDEDELFYPTDESYYAAMYDLPVWRFTITLGTGDQTTIDGFKLAFVEFFTNWIETAKQHRIDDLQELMERVESHRDRELIAQRIRRYEGLEAARLVCILDN